MLPKECYHMFNNIPGLPIGAQVKGTKIYCSGDKILAIYLRVDHQGKTMRYSAEFEGDSRRIRALQPLSVSEYRKLQKEALNAASTQH